MMFNLETLRLIRKTFRRFLSLSLIVFIGSGFIMGLMSTPRVMRESVDRYLDETEISDLVVYSPYGFCNEDYIKLSETEGIKTVFASKEIDCHGVDEKKETSTYRVSEISRKNNRFNLVEGRLPEKPNECIYLNNDLDNNRSIGEKITLNYGDNDINEYLSENEYTIVGIFETPQHMSKVLGSSNFNNEDLDCIIFIPNVNFISDYYTTMYITLDGSLDYISNTKKYDEFIEKNKYVLQDVASKQQSYLRDKLVAEATEQLDESEALFNQMKEEGQRQLDEAKNQLDDARIQIASYEAQLTVLDGVVRSLEASLRNDAELFGSIYGYTLEAEEDISNILNYFGLNGFNAASAAMEYTYNEYVKAINQFNSLHGQLNYAKQQYEDGMSEYTKAVIEFEKKVADGEEEIKLARAKLNDLPKSNWIVLDRDMLYSSLMYKNTCEQMASIGTYLPIMFFLVAALVCLTTMKRLVDEQRGQIGIYVALGYSNAQVIGKYVLYALLASLSGGILGIIVGQFLFPTVIYNTWNMMYYLPPIKFMFPIKNALISIGLFAVLMCGLTAYVVRGTVNDVPASLMRPVAPKKGKEVLIEKIPFLWNALSFTSKITARNIFRYKSRFLMTIAGIAGCTGLLIMGFGIKDSVNDVLDIQYGYIYDYDYAISLKSSDNLEENINTLLNNPALDSVSSYMTYTTRAYLDTGEKTAQMLVLDPRNASEIFNLRGTDKKTPLKLNNDGVIVTELFAKNNNLKVGDYITIESKNRIKGDVKISDICEMYFQHQIFMSDAIYEDIFDEKPTDTVIVVNSDDRQAVKAEAARLKDFAYLTDLSAMMDSFDDMIQALNLIIAVVILVAGSLAFVVLVNLTQVNISERVREIATLKVLGFNDHEVNMYIFKEIMLLSFIGCLVGIPIGIIEHRFIMNALTMEMIMFGQNINLSSFLFSIVITIIFTIIVLSFMRKPLQKVDMVESLKSIE